MDKLAGLWTQINTLKKRLNSLDLSKEDPGVASALKADLDALEDRYTKISEAKKKRQQEKLSKDAPVTVPEVTKEATPPAEAKPEPEPSIADKMTAPAEAPPATAPVVESAEDLEAKKKKKKRCNNCGGHYFPIGFGSHPTPCSHSGPSSDSGDGDMGGAPPAGGMGDGGAGAGAAGGGGAAAAAPTDALLHKFSADDVVEPTKGTPGSWGSVLRHDGGPEDLVYVKWHGGPLKEMHSGYGGYTATDLRKKANLETDALKPKKNTALDSEIQNAVVGYQINIMELSKVRQAGEAAFAAGQNVTEAVHAFLDSLVAAGKATKVASKTAAGNWGDCGGCGHKQDEHTKDDYKCNVCHKECKTPKKVADLETDGIPSAMEIAETFVNGNISDAREWVGGDLEKFMAVLDILGYGSEEGRRFQRLMRSGKEKRMPTPQEQENAGGGFNRASAAPITKEEDLEVDAVKNSEVVQAFFNGAKHGKTKNVSINQTNVGMSLWNYSTPIVLEKQGTYYFNTQKYSPTTSKLQNVIRTHLSGTKFKEVTEAGLREAMGSSLEKPRPPKDPNNTLFEQTPSMDLGNMPDPVENPEETPLQVANLDSKLTKKAVKVEFVEDETKRGPSLEGLTKFLNEEFKKMDPKSAVDSMESRLSTLALDWAEKNGYKMEELDGDILRFTQKHLGDVKLADVDPSEKGGVGYGGDRPGVAVAPSRDEDVTLDASLSKVAYIREEDGKWYVYSKKGKRLSKGYGSKNEANKRLREIEYFKHQGSMKLSSRDVKSEGQPLATEITQQVQKIRERMTTFQEGLKTQASAGSDEAFKLLKLDIESLRQRYATDPEAMKALDAIVYEMEQLTHTPEVSAVPKEGAGSNVPPKPSTDPGLNMMWWYNTTTNTWEIKNKTI